MHNYLHCTRSAFMRSGFFLAMFFALALSARAEDKDKSQKDQPLIAEPVIVTASRIEQATSTVTVPYSVVTQEELEVRKNTAVSTYLSNLPGVTVTRSGTRGRQADVLIRGANNSQTLVLIDGVKVNSPTAGNYNFNGLSTENIERIEVIRGPQSALYGSDAIGGVVNIITRQGEGAPEATTQFEYGTGMTFDEKVTVRGATDGIRYSGGFSRLDTEGRSLDDEFNATDASARLGVDITDWLDWDSTFRYNKNYVMIDDGPFRVDPNRFTRTKDDVVSTKLHAVMLGDWDHSVQFSGFHTAQLSIDPRDPGTTQVLSTFKLDASIYNIHYQNVLPLWDFMTLSSGVEYEQQFANNKSFRKYLHNTGVYIQDQISLWERWEIQAGVRLGRNSEFGNSTDPRVSQAYRIKETNSTIKAGYGTGFRAPTLNQLFFPGFGNPDLLPEESTNYDIGWEQGITKTGAFEVSLFHNSIEDLIQNVPVGGVTLPLNTGKAVIDGAEMETRWDFFDKHLNLRVYYDLLLTQDKSTEGKELTRRPKHAGGFAAEWHFWDRWTFFGNWVLVGARKDRTGLAGRPSREVNPSYEKLDMTLSYDWNRASQIFGRIENATSRFYSEVLGFPAEGTTFFVGLKIGLQPFKK